MPHRIYQENKPAYIAVRAFSTDQIGYGPKRKSGIQRIATALGCDYYTVYRWLLPKSRKGTGGIVPHKWRKRLYKAAQEERVLLTMQQIEGDDE